MSVRLFAAGCACLRAISIPLAINTMLVLPSSATAGSRPQVDLSVSVSTTPVPFVPGGRGTITLTVHNAGPDVAGVIKYPGSYAIDVIQNGFIITSLPPPYEIRDPVNGCVINETITEPLPDGNIALIWEFYFEEIPADGSRVCTFDIEFYPFTSESFSTGWHVISPNDDDTNPDNDRVSYIFQAPVASVPATSWRSLIALGIGLLALAGCMRSRKPT